MFCGFETFGISLFAGVGSLLLSYFYLVNLSLWFVLVFVWF